MSPVLSKYENSKDRDRTPPTRNCKISFKVDAKLLDMMATDEISRNRTALDSLKEKEKIARAEQYLRRRFR